MQQIKPKCRLYRGSIAIFDALGTKALWDKLPAHKLMTLYKSVESKAKRDSIMSQSIRNTSNGPTLETGFLFFSDTVAIYAFCRDDNAPDEWVQIQTIYDVVGRTSLLLKEAALNKPPLMYRGSIAYGELLVDPPFYLGNAAIEAARFFEKAECGCVWLTPDTANIYDSLKNKQPELDECLIKHDIPLKNAPERLDVSEPITEPSYAVNLLYAVEQHHRCDVLECLAKSFGENPTGSQLRKRNNTLDLFNKLGQ
ncbi:MAG: hypothetical protein ABFD49_07030 [Armatimonadota bacterium]|nr:hypothetical protein [bacterium]